MSTSTTGNTIETQIFSPDSGKEKESLLSGKEKAKKDHGNDVNRYTIFYRILSLNPFLESDTNLNCFIVERQ